MANKKLSKKESAGVKIIASKTIDYPFLNNDLLNLNTTTTIGHNNDRDNPNNVTPKRSKTNNDIQHVHRVDLEITRSRHKGRTMGGQSKQNHSSVYE
jgi:hypothetical protein